MKTSTLDTIKQALNTDNNDKEPSDYNEREATVMPQAKESSHAHAVKTSTLDTNKQTLNVDKNADTRIARGREINKLTDNQDPQELPGDPKAAAHSAKAPWLDYYVQALKAAAEWTGYNRLTEDGPRDMRTPRRVRSTTETTIPDHAEVTKAAAVHEGHEAARHRLTTTPVTAGDLDVEVNDPDSEYNGGLASVAADDTQALRPLETDVGPPAMDTGAADARRSDGLRLPDDAPPRARFVSLPNIFPTAVRSSAPRHDTDNLPPDATDRTGNNMTAVWSSAPRPDTDIQPPDTTDRMDNNITAVRSLAPRPWHTSVRRNRTTLWRPQPLCYIGLITHIILLLLHNGDGGVEPCSPPANTTNQTTYQNITTHYRMANGGAEQRSPPTTPTITTVRSPAPCPCHTNHTVAAAQVSAQELHRRLGIHPVLHATPLPSHTPHCSRTRNSRDTAFSHRSTSPSQPHPAWRCRSVIVSGAGPPVCLPAAGSVKGIKHALHHLTPHLPPPQHQRLFYQRQPLGDHDPTPTTTTTGPIHLTLRLVGLKGGGRRSRRDTYSDSTSDSDSDSYSRRKKSRKRSSKGEPTQALRAMTSIADSVTETCRSIQQPQQTVTPEASAPQRGADRHSDQARTQAEPPQGEAEPQARRRYCVSIDTRQGERQASLHEPGQQPQHPPLCPPTPVAEPLRFYRNPHSLEAPCAVPALQHGHRDVNRQPLPHQAATRMEHTAAQPMYHSEPLYVPQTQHEPQVQYRAATRMERTAAQPVYHSEPLYVPQTQHEPQVQYRAVVDRHGQHILPEDSTGTWARFSEQNAAALEILRTDPPMQRRTDAEPATGYLDMWLSRDRTRPLADPHAPRQQPTDKGAHPFPEPAPEAGHPQQHQQVYYTPDAPDQHPVNKPGPPQIHGERAPWHDAHAEQAPAQGPEPR